MVPLCVVMGAGRTAARAEGQLICWNSETLPPLVTLHT
jgi:hypothetical protein